LGNKHGEREIGSYIASELGELVAVAGLIYGTVAMALIAFLTVWFLPEDRKS
jgi:hypothetical protein